MVNLIVQMYTTPGIPVSATLGAVPSQPRTPYYIPGKINISKGVSFDLSSSNEIIETPRDFTWNLI